MLFELSFGIVTAVVVKTLYGLRVMRVSIHRYAVTFLLGNHRHGVIIALEVLCVEWKKEDRSPGSARQPTGDWAKCVTIARVSHKKRNKEEHGPARRRTNDKILLTFSRCYLTSATAKDERENQAGHEASDMGHVRHATCFSRLCD